MLLAFLFLGAISVAKPTSETTSQKDFSKYEAIDMNQFKGLEKQTGPSPKIKGSVGCTSATGTQYEKGDAGFGTCMGEFEAEKARGEGQKRGSSPSVNLQFGQ